MSMEIRHGLLTQKFKIFHVGAGAQLITVSALPRDLSSLPQTLIGQMILSSRF